MKLNKKGFTLVELLVTIVIVSLVIALSVFGIIKAIDASKDKAGHISEASLFEAARIYSGEASSDSWKNAEGYEAFCVTIGELMNKGLVNESDSVNRDDFIIVKRNKDTLAIEKEEMATSGDNYTICTGESVTRGETIVKPEISGSTRYTDKLVINFTNGSAKYRDGNTEVDSEVSYDCLYGDTSSSISRIGNIEGNRCVIDNLRNDKDYYVIVYMNTNHGSTVMAEGDKNFRTSNFKDTSFTTSTGNIRLTFDDNDNNGNPINSPSHYFKSSIVGTSNVDVKSCTVNNNVFTCDGSSTRNIDSNVWYKVDGTTVNISYANNTDNIDITTRIYDGSYNYKENTDNFVNKSFSAKFYKNTADSVDGSTSSYVTKTCSTLAGGGSSGSCSITAPSIVKSEWDIVGWNTSSSATSSSWNVGSSKTISSNVSYYAITRKTLTATFDKNGATSIGSASKSCYIYNSNTSCNITSPTITRSGWSIVGWNTSSSGTTSSLNVSTSKTLTDNVTYYAVTKKDLTATFEKNGATSIGSASKSCTIYNTNTSCSVTSPSITRSGWTIVGWNTSSSSTSSSWSVNGSKSISGNVTYYAVTKKAITATFDKNGATSVGSSSLSCDVYNTNSSCSITSPTITRSGWSIVGWNTSSSGTSSGWNVGSSKTISSNVTYYAITRKALTATFDKNGATSIGSTSQSCNIYNTNTSCSITSPSITRSGWTIVGWNTSSSGTSSNLNVNTSKSISGNVTYYAVTKKAITATFDKNGAASIGSSSVSCDVYNTNSSCSITAPSITRSGWDIIGWNTSSSSTSSDLNVGSSKTISSNVTYYAITKGSFTATFNKNGATSIGSSSESCTVYNTTSSCSVTSPSITRSGWTIVGWNTSSSGTTSDWNVNSSKSISGNVTYYAVTKGSFTATFNKNGATSIGSTSLSCTAYNNNGCSITSPSITRSGWTIVGWNTSSSGTSSGWNVGASKSISSDVTYYAITSKSVTVSFNGNGGSAGSSSKSCTMYNTVGNCNISMPSASRSGFNFNGWSTSSSASSGSYYSGSSYAFSSNATLYATWVSSCSGRSGTKEVSASDGFKCRVKWSTSCNSDGTREFYVDRIEFMSTDYTYVWFKLDGYVYVNDREILWANSKASGPHISLDWFYETDVWYNIDQDPDYRSVTVSGTTVTIKFDGYNESKFYAINDNYNYAEFYVSSSSVTIDIS